MTFPRLKANPPPTSNQTNVCPVSAAPPPFPKTPNMKLLVSSFPSALPPASMENPTQRAPFGDPEGARLHELRSSGGPGGHGPLRGLLKAQRLQPAPHLAGLGSLGPSWVWDGYGRGQQAFVVSISRVPLPAQIFLTSHTLRSPFGLLNPPNIHNKGTPREAMQGRSPERKLGPKFSTASMLQVSKRTIPLQPPRAATPQGGAPARRSRQPRRQPHGHQSRTEEAGDMRWLTHA